MTDYFYDGIIPNYNSGTNAIKIDPTSASSTISLTNGTTTNTLTQSDWTGNIRTVNTLVNATHYLNFSDSASTGQGHPQKNGFLTCNPSLGSITAGSFVGDLTGNSSSATTSTSVVISNNNTNNTFYPVFTDGSGSSRNLSIDITTGPLTYNPSTRTLTALVFSGSASTIALTPDDTAGNYYIPFSKTITSTANTLFIDNTTTPLSYNPNTSTLTSTVFSGNLSGTATLATNSTASNSILIADNNTNATFYPVFATTTGVQSLYVDSATGPLSYNPSTATLTSTNFNGLATSATSSVGVDLTSDNTSTTCYIPFSKTTTATGNALFIDNTTTPLSYNPSNAILTVDSLQLTTSTIAITSFTAGVLTLPCANLTSRNFNWVPLTTSALTMTGLTLTSSRANAVYHVGIFANGVNSLTINSTGLGTNVFTKYTSAYVIPSFGYAIMEIKMLSINAVLRTIVDVYSVTP